MCALQSFVNPGVTLTAQRFMILLKPLQNLDQRYRSPTIFQVFKLTLTGLESRFQDVVCKEQNTIKNRNKPS
ncbi:MAG TPA: hypothetical protein DCS45_14515 [Roseovarius nubinhibens]|uniref:Uncharacterized protein n=1 Tax=Roseovarius nubinhibens TaxID=314263 RepID=A0A348WEW0_9RHOB|nr:hypothetical protein [Roseovarius nubinhibens]